MKHVSFDPNGALAESDAPAFDILPIIRRQWLLIAVMFTFGAIATALFLVFASPRYAATAEIVIEPRRYQLMQAQIQTPQDAASVSAAVETHAEILRSEDLATEVVRKLGLMNDPDYVRRPMPIVDAVRAWLGLPEETQDAQMRLKKTVDLLKFRLSVRRVALTTLIDITATSYSAERAAQIANIAAETFARMQMEASMSAAQNADEWLKSRLLELREQSEASELAVANFKLGIGSQEGGRLRELASRAQTYRSLYDAFLARVATAKLDLYPFPESRLVSAATPPVEASFPKPAIIAPAGLLVSAFLSLFTGWAWGRFRHMIVSPEDVHTLLSTDCLGPVAVPEASRSDRVKAENAKGPPAVFGLAETDPLAQVSIAVRHVRLLIDMRKSHSAGKIVALTSISGRAGGSVIAANLAVAAAAAGARVLLVDVNLKNPTLTHVLGASGNQKPSLCGHQLTEFLTFLPAPESGVAPHPAEYLASAAFKTRIKEARQAFDYIILDLPKMDGDMEVRACAEFIDDFILALRFGRDSAGDLKSALKAAPLASSKLAVALLTTPR